MRKKLFYILPIFLLLFSMTLKPAQAAISACSVTVSPTTIDGGSSQQLVFSITNNDQDSNLLYWVKVIAPSADFTLTSGDGPSLGGVTISDDKSSVAVNTTLSGGETGDFTVGVTAGDNGVSAAAFTVLASATSAGDESTTCTGDSSVSIAANIQAILSISNVKIAASDSSATISWTSGGTATGFVDYGLESSYGTVVSDTNSGTAHSVTLNGLSSNTTYHFRITSSDGDQNVKQSADNTFTTAAAGATTTVTTTVTTTTTTIKNIIQEIKDTTPPAVKISTDFATAYRESPVILGEATDDSGVATVQYSVDGGENWINVGLSGNVGKKKAPFQFTPSVIDDGNYSVQVLVTDSSGNVKRSEVQTLIIDRLPPKVGSVLFSLGPIILKPDQNGNIHAVSGLHTTVTLSAVGGPTLVELVAGQEKYRLVKNIDTGLWSGDIVFPSEGEYQLSAQLVDGADHHTERDLHKIIIQHTGKITSEEGNVSSLKMSVYVFDPDSKQFVLWNAFPFGQENPVMITPSGKYSLFLTTGKFYIELSGDGFKKVRTNIFEVTKPTPITTDFQVHTVHFSALTKILTFLGLEPTDEVSLSLQDSIPSSAKSALVGSEIPLFDITSQFRGKPTVLTFITTWLPQASEQIEELQQVQAEIPEVHFVVIGVQEPKNKLDLFMKRGGYDLTAVADPDGKFVEPLSLETLPTSIFLDRKGTIQSVFVGVMDKNHIKSTLIY